MPTVQGGVTSYTQITRQPGHGRTIKYERTTGSPECGLGFLASVHLPGCSHTVFAASCPLVFFAPWAVSPCASFSQVHQMFASGSNMCTVCIVSCCIHACGVCICLYIWAVKLDHQLSHARIHPCICGFINDDRFPIKAFSPCKLNMESF